MGADVMREGLSTAGVASPHDASRNLPVVPYDVRVQGEQNGEVGWVELLVVLLRNKTTILAITLTAAVGATVIAFLLPKAYTATATILPPQQKASAVNLLLGQTGVLGGLSETDFALKDSQDLFVGMLKSRSIQDDLINNFDLRRVYGVKLDQDARKKLNSRSDIVGEDNGLISISVTDRDPQRAADLANAYVDGLRTLNQKLAISEASQRRLFYEQKADAERDALSVAEVQLKQDEEKTGLLQPDAQAKVLIQSVADMRAAIAMREVKIQAMRTYATKDNPELVRAEQEVAGLKAQLAKMERSGLPSPDSDVGLPVGKLPQAELEYLRRARDLKYHEALYEFLNKQLEAARIDEGKQAIVIQVVDKAVIPERRTSPRRALIVAVTALLAFLLSCFWAFCAEALRRRQQDPLQRERFASLKQSLNFSSKQP